MAIDIRKDIIETVIRQTTELLHTRVWALDRHEVVIASSDPCCIGLPFAQVSTDSQACLRVPMHLDGQGPTCVVTEVAENESTPPHLARALIELMINQATVVRQLPNQQQLEGQFVYSLLFEPITDEALVLRRGQAVGIDLTIPRAVLLIDASEHILGTDGADVCIADEARAYRRAEAVITHIVDFFHLPRSTICTYIGGGEIVVLKASSSKDLSAWTDREDVDELPIASWANLTALKRAASALLARLRRSTGSTMTIGIGRYHPGINGLPRSYEDARAALSLGRRFQGPNLVHCLDDLGIAAFVGVSDVRTKIDLATHLLSPLDHEDELLLTLNAFFDQDCSASATACCLGIHRNTLNYRLDKIASLTGLDPHRFDDAVQIRLALVLRALESSPSSCASARNVAARRTQTWANA